MTLSRKTKSISALNRSNARFGKSRAYRRRVAISCGTGFQPVRAATVESSRHAALIGKTRHRHMVFPVSTVIGKRSVTGHGFTKPCHKKGHTLSLSDESSTETSAAGRICIDSRRPLRMTRRIFAFVFFVVCTAACAGGTVTVRKSTPSVHRQTFDPNKPPYSAMPKLFTSPEAAATVCSFGFSAEPVCQ